MLQKTLYLARSVPLVLIGDDALESIEPQGVRPLIPSSFLAMIPRQP